MNSNFKIFNYISNNNINNINKLIKNNKYILYNIYYNNLYPIHYACFYGKKDIIDLLIKYDNNILNQLDINNNTAYYHLMLYPKLFNKYLISNPPKIINHINNDNKTLLTHYLFICDNYDKKILNVFKKLNANLLEPKDYNPLFYLIPNKCDKILLLNEYFKIDVNLYYNNKPISFNLLDNNNIKCLKLLLKLGLDINLRSYYDNILSYSIIDKNDFMINWIINNTKISNNYTDINEYNYLHMALNVQNDTKVFNNNTLIKLLDKIDINQQNSNGDSIIHYISYYNLWNIFIDEIKNKNVDINIKNKRGLKPLDLIKDKNYKNIIKKQLNIININNVIDVNFIKQNNIPTYTPFYCNIYTNLSHIIYILRKYNNISFPIDKDYNLINIINNIYINDNEIIYSLNGLKKIIHKKYIFLFVVIDTSYIKHINIILINNTDKVIEHFESHGKSVLLNNNDIYKIKNEILNEIKNITNIKYKYYTPFDYQNYHDFQDISMENINKYFNETGFCGAWIIWYLEHRLLNHKMKPNILITKLKKKLISNKIEILDHIRSYANKLHKFHINIMKEANIPRKYFYQIDKNNNILDKYINYTLNEISKLNKT